MSNHVNQFGVLAQFADADALIETTRKTHEEGYRHVEAYSPYPIEEVSDAMDFTRTRIPMVVLVGGITGAVLGFALQYWSSVIEYPLNIGGRPLNSWPSFIPVTFEMTILVGSLSAVLGMLALNGLPRPHHPLFAVPQFDRASQDKFFLCIRATDPMFQESTTRQWLQQFSPEEVVDVPL